MTDPEHHPLDPDGESADEHEIVDPTDVELVDGDGIDDTLPTTPELGALRSDVGDADLTSWQDDDLDPDDLDLDLDLDPDPDPDDLLDLLSDDGSDAADDLDVDGEAAAEDRDGPDDDQDDTQDESDDRTPERGVFEPNAIVAWAADGAVAGVDRAAFDLAVAALHLDPLDLDGRQTVHVLDHLGVDARVEHGSIDDLVDRLERGARLEIVSGDERFAVTRVDDLHDTMVLRANGSGAIVEVALDRFEAEWAAAAYEMVVADGATPSTLIALDIGRTGEEP